MPWRGAARPVAGQRHDPLIPLPQVMKKGPPCGGQSREDQIVIEVALAVIAGLIRGALIRKWLKNC
jgi:hypothetical protein